MSDGAVLIDFSPTGEGWAAVTLRIGNNEFIIDSASYCTDVIGDLLRSALMLVTGETLARVSFDGEPREWRLIVSSPGDGVTLRCGCSVMVLEFANIDESLPDNEGSIAFKAECTLGEFAAAVLAMARRVMNTGDIEAYKWGDWPFPLRTFRALEAALAVENLPVSQHH